MALCRLRVIGSLEIAQALKPCCTAGHMVEDELVGRGSILA